MPHFDFSRFRCWNSTTLVLGAAGFFLVFYNHAFFRNLLDIYPLRTEHGLFLGSLLLFLYACLVLVLALINFRFIQKPLLILVLLLSSLASYFMDSYNVVIDSAMLQNVLNTDYAEATDLLSIRLILHFLLLGVLPSLFVFWLRIKPRKLAPAALENLAVIVVSLGIIVSQPLLFNKHYSSFFREHRNIRYYANPHAYIYAGYRFYETAYAARSQEINPIGQDARIPASDNHRELIILVIGETARADHFSLNGYNQPTNPNLEKEQVVSFKNVSSCGTSTAVSVPCMFSALPRGEYSESRAHDTENLLDVLSHAGATILWRDNNSDSKHVALRVPYEDYKSPLLNSVCDSECRDEGMLVGLQGFIDSHANGDIVIVLHQIGNHGPAYYKRYPARFERFTPACHTNQLEACSRDEINNAYDNAILYTDYFLSQVIDLLKRNDNAFETAMLYVSDHGESLGENNLYLHGMPYLIAPEAQKHVAAILWLGNAFREDGLDISQIKRQSDESFSHDNLFHTVLGLLELQTSVYDKSLDILAQARDGSGNIRTALSAEPSLPDRHVIIPPSVPARMSGE